MLHYMGAYHSRLKAKGTNTPQVIRDNADMVSLNTWYNDPQVRPAILYRHDKNGRGTLYEEIAREDIKFIHKELQTFASQTVEYYIMFKPKVHYPLGSYIDIPDEMGAIKRWLIVEKSNDPQFAKYSILPCNYTLKWVHEGSIYECLCVVRAVNSYSSGVFEGTTLITTDNRCKVVMPTDYISQALYYDKRIIVSSDRDTPFVWKTTKVEELTPVGVSKFTISQDVYNEDTDFSEKYGMIADINCQVIIDDEEIINENRSEIIAYRRKRVGGKMEWVEIIDNIVRVGSTVMFVCKFIDKNNTVRTDIVAKWSVSGLERYKTNSHGVIEEDKNGPIIEGHSYSAYEARGMTLTFKLNKDYNLGGTRFAVSVSDGAGDFASTYEMEVRG